jgi:hypothetical protein
MCRSATGHLQTTAIVPPTSSTEVDVSDIATIRNDTKRIKGIGRNFNKELGLKAFRTACAIEVAAPMDECLTTIRTNMTRDLQNPKHTCRILCAVAARAATPCTPPPSRAHAAARARLRRRD